jgi:hypothetical protein
LCEAGLCKSPSADSGVCSPMGASCTSPTQCCSMLCNNARRCL